MWPVPKKLHHGRHSVILNAAKNLPRLPEILRYAQDDTADLSCCDIVGTGDIAADCEETTASRVDHSSPGGPAAAAGRAGAYARSGDKGMHANIGAIAAGRTDSPGFVVK